MSKVKYSKKRIVGQSATKSLKYMAPLKPGSVLTIEDVIIDTFEGANGPVMNDHLLCADEEGHAVKVPVREYAKMKIEGEGKAYASESDTDEITLPNQIIIRSSEDRKYTPQGKDEEVTLFPTFSYNDAQEFVDSKGEMTWDALLESGVREDNQFSAVQNYTASVE